jgi:hypothetical protein
MSNINDDCNDSINTDDEITDYEITDYENTDHSQEMLLKIEILRKLNELKQRGTYLSQEYTMKSDLETMQYEFKLHIALEEKRKWIQSMTYLLVSIVQIFEVNVENIFNVKISMVDKITSHMDNYYQVLGDLYEKYKLSDLIPEIKLIKILFNTFIVSSKSVNENADTNNVSIIKKILYNFLMCFYHIILLFFNIMMCFFYIIRFKIK